VSSLRDIEQLLTDIVDHSVELTGAERGFLIMVGANGQPEIRVARSRDKQSVAEDVRFSTSVVGKVLSSGEPMLSTVQGKLPGARILPGSYFDVPVAIGVVKGRPPAVAEFARAYSDDVKRSGFVQQAIDRAGATGMVVAT